MGQFSHQNVFACLGVFSLGKIPRDFRCTYDSAFYILDRRDGERNRNQAAVLAPTNGFIAFDALSAPNSLTNGAFFMLSVWGDQNRDRFADRFFGRITEHSHCALVPTGNDGVEGLADDSVITRLDNGREPPKTLFAFA